MGKTFKMSNRKLNTFWITFEILIIITNKKKIVVIK